MTALTTPEQINTYRLMTLKAGLKLEIKGLRMSRGRTCYAILKAEGYTGSRETVLTALTQHIDQLKAA